MLAKVCGGNITAFYLYPRMKNYLVQTFWLTLLVVALLTGLSMVSRETNFNGFTLRRMDIFADIRDSSARAAELPPPKESVEAWQPDTVGLAELADSLATADTLALGPLPPKDPAYYGAIIEDYTWEQEGLARFFAAVDSIRLGRTVRVAFYGDSFVEGDIVLGDLRDSLQSAWGGSGVGFVPITSEVAQYKRTLQHEYSGFTAQSIITRNGARPTYGLNGFVYFPQPGATVRYKGTGQFFKHTRAWSRLRLFYTSDSLSNEMIVRINERSEGSGERAVLPRSRGRVGIFDYKQAGIYQAQLDFPNPENLRLYGASLESGPGFYLDNFSLRSNSGGPLTLLKPGFIRQFDAWQRYDLVIVQYGLNAAGASLGNINWYKHELDKTFAHLRILFPHAPILIVSVPDRGGKIDGELASMPSVAAITSMQRDLARKHGFLFYDLFHGMGGPSTMIEFANRKPRLANLDYTHLTHDGGKVVGHQLARLFLQAQANWRAQQ